MCTWMTFDLALLMASAFSLLERFRKFSNSAFSRRNLSCAQTSRMSECALHQQTPTPHSSCANDVVLGHPLRLAAEPLGGRQHGAK